MRGKQASFSTPRMGPRNIPAYAGKTLAPLAVHSALPEHPRVCGENMCETSKMLVFYGTSPRMRGKLNTAFRNASGLRNIPAYAGKTRTTQLSSWVRTEHPRVCGENSTPAGEKPPRGTSPRMRGKLGKNTDQEIATRNIPAYAGKTWTIDDLLFYGAEHPRVCGENYTYFFGLTPKFGTSPRMRGKPFSGAKLADTKRNIPAYAGKTYRPHRSGPGSAEHPRVCGENVSAF